MFVNKPKVSRVDELKWNHIISPEVNNKADSAPVKGQGLGFTM